MKPSLEQHFSVGKMAKTQSFLFHYVEPVCIMNIRVIEKIYLEQCLCNTGSSTAGPSIRASLWWSLPSLLDPHLPPWACLAPPLLGSCQKSLWTSDSAYWFASIAQFLGCTTCSGREKSLDFGVFFQLVSSWLLSQCLLLLKWYETINSQLCCWRCSKLFATPQSRLLERLQQTKLRSRFSMKGAVGEVFNRRRSIRQVFNEQSGARGFQATERE